MAASQSSSLPGLFIGKYQLQSSAPKNYAEEELQPIKLVLCTHHCDPNTKVEDMAKLVKVN